MRSRIAITAVLATGTLMTGGGAALGVSALSTDLSAQSAQYGQGAGPTRASVASETPSGRNPGSGVLGEGGQGGGEQGGAPGSGVLGGGGPGAGPAGAVGGVAAAQAPREVEMSAGDQLPFTGFAAIPMLLVGLALLGSGLVLRRSARRAPAQL